MSAGEFLSSRAFQSMLSAYNCLLTELNEIKCDSESTIKPTCVKILRIVPRIEL